MNPDLGDSDQAKRIQWRERLMRCDGGPEWLLHVSRLYGFREKLLGPDHIGLPDTLSRQMANMESDR